MHTHEPECAHAVTRAREPSGVPQESDPRLVPTSRGSCRRLNLHVSAHITGVPILFLHVQPPWKTLHKTKSFLVPCSVINNVDEEDAARIPSQSSRCKELIFYNYIYTTHPARTPTAWHCWLYLSPGHLSLCQNRIKNAAAHSTVQLNDRDINGII